MPKKKLRKYDELIYRQIILKLRKSTESDSVSNNHKIVMNDLIYKFSLYVLKF